MGRRRVSRTAVARRIYVDIEREHAQNERRVDFKNQGTATVEQIAPPPLDPIEQARAVGAALRGAV